MPNWTPHHVTRRTPLWERAVRRTPDGRHGASGSRDPLNIEGFFGRRACLDEPCILGEATRVDEERDALPPADVAHGPHVLEPRRRPFSGEQVVDDVLGGVAPAAAQKP